MNSVYNFVFDHVNPMWVTAIGVLLIVAGASGIVGTVRRARRRAQSPLLTGAAVGGATSGLPPAPRPSPSWDSAALDYFGPATTAAGTAIPAATVWRASTTPRPARATGPARRSMSLPREPLLVSALMIAAGLLALLPMLEDAATVRHVHVPEQAGDLGLIPTRYYGSGSAARTNAAVQELERATGVRNVKFGVYAKGASQSPAVMLIIADVPGLPSYVEFYGNAAPTTLAPETPSVLYPTNPGRLGGELRCGDVSYGGATVPTCAWIDSDTAGMVIVSPAYSDDAAATARMVRRAAEH